MIVAFDQNRGVGRVGSDGRDDFLIEPIQVPQRAAVLRQPVGKLGTVVVLDSVAEFWMWLVERIEGEDRRVIVQGGGEILPKGEGLIAVGLILPEAIVAFAFVVLAPAGARQTEHAENDPLALRMGQI